MPGQYWGAQAGPPRGGGLLPRRVPAVPRRTMPAGGRRSPPATPTTSIPRARWCCEMLQAVAGPGAVLGGDQPLSHPPRLRQRHQRRSAPGGARGHRREPALVLVAVDLPGGLSRVRRRLGATTPPPRRSRSPCGRPSGTPRTAGQHRACATATPRSFRAPVAIRVGTAAGDMVARVDARPAGADGPDRGVRSAPTMVVFDDENAMLKTLDFRPADRLARQPARSAIRTCGSGAGPSTSSPLARTTRWRRRALARAARWRPTTTLTRAQRGRRAATVLPRAGATPRWRGRPRIPPRGCGRRRSRRCRRSVEREPRSWRAGPGPATRATRSGPRRSAPWSARPGGRTLRRDAGAPDAVISRRHSERRDLGGGRSSRLGAGGGSGGRRRSSSRSRPTAWPPSRPAATGPRAPRWRACWMIGAGGCGSGLGRRPGWTEVEATPTSRQPVPVPRDRPRGGDRRPDLPRAPDRDPTGGRSPRR